MGSDYWRSIRAKIQEIWTPGDALLCINIVDMPGGSCQLCGRPSIRWNHTLANTRTKLTLNLGSNCIHNYKKVVAQLGHNLDIVYPEALAGVAKQLNARHPDTVRVQPATALGAAMATWARELKELEKWNDDESDLELEHDDRAPEGMDADDMDSDS